MAVVKILSSSLFTDREKLPLLLLAVSNGPGEVEFIAESALKTLEMDSLINNSEVCKVLFNIYLGNSEKVRQC